MEAMLRKGGYYSAVERWKHSATLESTLCITVDSVSWIVKTLLAVFKNSKQLTSTTVVNAKCFIREGTSKSAIGRTVQTRLGNGNIRWSWKRLCRAKQEKVRQENIDYCQDFLNYLSRVDLCKISFLTKLGFGYLNATDQTTNILLLTLHLLKLEGILPFLT